MRQNFIFALLGLIVIAAAVFGYSLTSGRREEPPTKAQAVQRKEQLRDACATPQTYDRLKEVAFEEALRIRNADPANLDQLATHSVVRMEDPVVKSRDEALNVTVCSGRFILELPPGAERAFGGERRLVADIEYSAQEAVDGSGLVYEIRGAEPLIQRLAAFDLQGPAAPAPAPPEEGETELAKADPSVRVEEEEEERAEERAPPARKGPVSILPPDMEEAERPRPAPRVEPRPVRQPPRSAAARPSFDCRYARTRSERMVCSSNRLASRDRAMSSLFYEALADADPQTRRILRRTRDSFLGYRERCPSEDCIAQAYEDRMEEIRDIMRDAD